MKKLILATVLALNTLSCSKNNQYTTQKIDYNSPLLITTSAENLLNVPYDDFTLGLSSIIATIELIDGEEIEIVLYDNIPLFKDVYTKPKSISLLSAITNKLFVGQYILPEGLLTSIKLIIAPNKSNMVINGQKPSLIDSYLNQYTDNADDNTESILT